jgi:hypothetical protein
VAYRLLLPASSAIHPVFHVSQLKKMVSPRRAVSSTLSDSASLYQVPEAVLDSRMINKRGVEVQQVLVKWSHMSQELATWEDKEALRQRFPAAPAWGQAGSQAQGVLAPLLSAQRLQGLSAPKLSTSISLDLSGPSDVMGQTGIERCGVRVIIQVGVRCRCKTQQNHSVVTELVPR